MIKKNFIIRLCILFSTINYIQCADNYYCTDIWTKIIHEIPKDTDFLKTLCIVKRIDKIAYNCVNSFLSMVALQLQQRAPISTTSKEFITHHYFVQLLQKIDTCIQFYYSYNPFRASAMTKIIFNNKNSEISLLNLENWISFFSKELKIDHKTFAAMCTFNQYLCYYNICDAYKNYTYII